MPTNRTRRRRQQVETDVISKLRAGADIEYSPENRMRIISAYYFRDPPLTKAEQDRARVFLDLWPPD